MHIAISEDHHDALRRVAPILGLGIPEAAEACLESNPIFKKALDEVRKSKQKVTA